MVIIGVIKVSEIPLVVIVIVWRGILTSGSCCEIRTASYVGSQWIIAKKNQVLQSIRAISNTISASEHSKLVLFFTAFHLLRESTLFEYIIVISRLPKGTFSSLALACRGGKLLSKVQCPAWPQLPYRFWRLCGMRTYMWDGTEART